MARYILPCPCCGGKSEFILQNEHTTRNCGTIRYGFVICTECELQQGTILPENKAVEKWNTRKQMDDIVERLEKATHSPNCSLYCGNERKCMGHEHKCGFDEMREYAIDIVRKAGKDGAE